MYKFTIEEVEFALTSFGKSCGIDDATIADAWHAMVVQLSIIAAKASGAPAEICVNALNAAVEQRADNKQSTPCQHMFSHVDTYYVKCDLCGEKYPIV